MRGNQPRQFFKKLILVMALVFSSMPEWHWLNIFRINLVELVNESGGAFCCLWHSFGP